MKQGTHGAAVSVNQEDAQDGDNVLQVEVEVEKEMNERFQECWNFPYWEFNMIMWIWSSNGLERFWTMFEHASCVHRDLTGSCTTNTDNSTTKLIDSGKFSNGQY